ncbi:hypothetical protein TWF481_010945 [Arthrobotrys musiformis]|uniref:Uncharacterized protein n=1 Tax=Arthrobotrys musiformis TaxID=47236 RepID=A0AAV9W2Y8_9PEZI
MACHPSTQIAPDNAGSLPMVSRIQGDREKRIPTNNPSRAVEVAKMAILIFILGLRPTTYS